MVSKRAKILIVDDERSLRELLEIFLKKEGFIVTSAPNAEEGLTQVKTSEFDLIISDIKMADMSGIDFLRELRNTNFNGQFILLTAFASAETAIQALKMGAFDYILKTENFMEELKLVVYNALENRRLREENTYLRREFKKVHGMGSLIGKSKKMQELFKMIEVVSATNSTVLITGESGTGKELVAKAIHLNSPRAEEAFVSVNCGAFTETLLESELFGYVRGAFTGAAANKKGLFEVADKGTIFLDEIGDTSLAMQVKLLRVLQERALRRVGGTEEIQVDVRIIAATNRDLSNMVQDGQFREDLFYRISVIPLELPPLRHRRDDIPLLADHFLTRLNASMGKKINRISDEALKKLESYDWPGNVRELENAMERSFILETSNELSAQHLPESVATNSRMRALTNFPDEGFDLESYVESLQKGFLEEALRRTDGVQVKAAELLRMSYRSFRHYMQKYNIPS
ncbi:MAG TPA: sigma-54 dependent transcriptional regulator [Terriglobia bacterium]|nr:sigma-54 dependent transcriptional regulator [Terriglobia bacterium]